MTMLDLVVLFDSFVILLGYSLKLKCITVGLLFIRQFINGRFGA